MPGIGGLNLTVNKNERKEKINKWFEKNDISLSAEYKFKYKGIEYIPVEIYKSEKLKEEFLKCEVNDRMSQTYGWKNEEIVYFSKDTLKKTFPITNKKINGYKVL